MARPDSPVSVADRLDRFDQHWSPKIIAEANGWEFKLVKVQGEFVWHTHEIDEVFWVLHGELIVRCKGRPDARLQTGDIFVVPRGQEHQPFAEKECHIALIEPAGVVNTGDNTGPRTAQDEWL